MGTTTGQEAGNVSVVQPIVRPWTREQERLRRRRIKGERKDAVQYVVCRRVG